MSTIFTGGKNQCHNDGLFLSSKGGRSVSRSRAESARTARAQARKQKIPPFTFVLGLKTIFSNWFFNEGLMLSPFLSPSLTEGKAKRKTSVSGHALWTFDLWYGDTFLQRSMFSTNSWFLSLNNFCCERRWC